MPRRSTISSAAAQFEFIPSNYFAPPELESVFGRAAPLEVELGSGDGAFIVRRAQQYPDRNFLGVERMAGRIRAACNKIARLGLTNVRVLGVEASYVVTYLLQPQSVFAFHLLFPDPWPKRRHERRRLVTPEFADIIHRALADNGIVQFATDQSTYFDATLRAFTAHKLFEVSDDQGELGATPTTFQQRFEAAGAPIYRTVLRKVSPLR